MLGYRMSNHPSHCLLFHARPGLVSLQVIFPGWDDITVGVLNVRWPPDMVSNINQGQAIIGAFN